MLEQLHITFFHLRLVVLAFVVNALYLAQQVDIVVRED